MLEIYLQLSKSYGVNIVVITRGRKGADVYDGKKILSC